MLSIVEPAALMFFSRLLFVLLQLPILLDFELVFGLVQSKTVFLVPSEKNG